MHSYPKNSPTYFEDDIAVIGMACRFPGARNLEEFWINLQESKDSIYHFTD